MNERTLADFCGLWTDETEVAYCHFLVYDPIEPLRNCCRNPFKEEEIEEIEEKAPIQPHSRNHNNENNH